MEDFVETIKEFEQTHQRGIQRILSKNYKHIERGNILIMKHPQTLNIYKLGLTNTKHYELMTNRNSYVINNRNKCIQLVHFFLKVLQPEDFNHPEIGNEKYWYEISFRNVCAIIEYVRTEYGFV